MSAMNKFLPGVEAEICFLSIGSASEYVASSKSLFANLIKKAGN
jgi:hypothetical protein